MEGSNAVFFGFKVNIIFEEMDYLSPVRLQEATSD